VEEESSSIGPDPQGF